LIMFSALARRAPSAVARHAAAWQPAAQLRLASTAAAVEEDKEEDKGLIASLGLDDWKKAVPLGIIVGIPLISQEVYVITEETQLAACFMLFTGVAYGSAGNAIGDALDEKGQGIIAEHHAIENLTVNAAKSLIETHKNRVSVASDAKDIYAEQLSILEDISTSRTNQLKHQMRAQIVRQLDTLEARESASFDRVQKALVAAATDSVKANFASNAAAKSAALDGAIAALANPDAGIDQETIPNMYKDYFRGYGERIAAATGKAEDLPADQVTSITEDTTIIQKQLGLDGVKFQSPTSVSL